jgi:short-subunit dehydrogenase
MKSFKNKVAAVTGAGSGIGRALAKALAREGAELAISDIQTERLEETAGMLRELGAKVSVQTLDVSNREQVFAWADQVAREHGRVNLIFNNAGVAHASTLEGCSIEDFEWIMSINFWGVVYGTKAFLPHLRAAGEGHIVNVSSIFGVIAVPGNGTYNASKFAVRGFTEALRRELADTKVCVRYVAPRATRTGINTSAVERMNDELGVAMDPPELVAKAVCDMLAGGKVEAVLGWPEKLFARVNGLLPRVVDGALRKQLPVIRRYAGESVAAARN